MPRVLLISLLGLLLLLPATAEGKQGVHVRGTVAGKSRSDHLVAVKAPRKMFSLRVPGSLTAIRAGQRVELRGSTLRAEGRSSRILATGVTVSSSQVLPTQHTSSSSGQGEDDEVEIKGKLTSLSPVTVASSSRTVTCAVPAGMTLAGLAIGDLVELECDLVGSSWVVRKLEPEDDEDDSAAKADDDDDEDDDGGHGDDDDDDDDSSGHGSGDDDHEDDD